MQNAVYSFHEFSFGSKIIRDLIDQSDNVKAFTGDFFTQATMEQKMEKRNLFSPDRQTLVRALTDQNRELNLSALTAKNIELLGSENTFTITTGHQLNLLTGPLFSIYKIAQVIAIASDLKKKYPNRHFVPVFWMATEDHDFEEINHIYLFNKKITWNKTIQEASVAGKIQTSGLTGLFEEIEALYQNEALKTKIKELAAFYLESENLAQATRKLVYHLFGETGLVILDGDDVSLKQQLKPVFLKEIKEQITFKAVSETNQKLETAGYHQQVHVRECNLFFIHADGKRERIIFENNQFKLDEKKLTAEELQQLIEQQPESFSPNALLRPVYQELILPNLVYVGGGGEIAYWLQLRSLFEQLNVSFPLLRVRDSVFLMNTKQTEDIEKSGLDLAKLQQPVDLLLKAIAVEKLGNSISFTEANADLQRAKNSIIEKVTRTDASLVTYVEAEFARMHAAVEKLEAKLIKVEKSKDESTKNRLVKLQEKLFPQGHFQERHENMLNYYLNDPGFIQKVLETVQAENDPKIRTLIL